VVFKSEHAHTDTLRDVAWSPLVPHWVATAGDDACVKVFDLRFGARPMMTMQCTVCPFLSFSSFSYQTFYFTWIGSELNSLGQLVAITRRTVGCRRFGSQAAFVLNALRGSASLD
jgi:WD40 repeat protein